MNLILFEPAELERPLPRTDRRAEHILQVLRRKVGDTFDAGVVDGARGKATLRALNDATLALEFAWTHPAAARAPITLVVGLPRPQTARDILRDATALGVGGLHFVRTERTEPGYADSVLWRSGEWRRHVLLGAEQAFDTRLPEVTWQGQLASVLDAAPPGLRVALDNYEAARPLGQIQAVGSHVTLVIGAERGWTATERALFRERGFMLAHLGTRVLRTETACIAALAVVRSKLGLL